MTPPFKTISVHQLGQHAQSTRVDLIDVRTPAEFRELHAEIAKNIPLDALDAASIHSTKTGDAGAPVFLICGSGNRSAMACRKLIESGFEGDVVNVDGGTNAWEEAGLAVVRGPKTISLERQVRIAAGSLVLVGSLLAYFVHPWIFALPAFVGGGLMFAGITDTCGMAMLLAKMPWNQISEGKQLNPI